MDNKPVLDLILCNMERAQIFFNRILGIFKQGREKELSAEKAYDLWSEDYDHPLNNLTMDLEVRSYYERGNA